MRRKSSGRQQPLLRRAAWLWLPPVAWMAAIFFLSAQPHIPGPPQPLLDLLLKKSGHFLGYGVLAVLLRRAFGRGRAAVIGGGAGDSRSPAGRRPAQVGAAALLVTVCYAISDEFHQSFIPGRNSSPVDVMIDTAGALAGLLVAEAVSRWVKPGH